VETGKLFKKIENGEEIDLEKTKAKKFSGQNFSQHLL
jgi:hypothetical protein